MISFSGGLQALVVTGLIRGQFLDLGIYGLCGINFIWDGLIVTYSISISSSCSNPNRIINSIELPPIMMSWGHCCLIIYRLLERIVRRFAGDAPTARRTRRLIWIRTSTNRHCTKSND